MTSETQIQIPGTEIEIDPKIVGKAKELFGLRKDRMSLARREKELATALIELCQDADFEPEDFESISADYSLRIKHTDVKVSVKSLVPVEDEEEGDDE